MTNYNKLIRLNHLNESRYPLAPLRIDVEKALCDADGLTEPSTRLLPPLRNPPLPPAPPPPPASLLPAA